MLAGARKNSAMYIQYVGFNVAASSRIYNFDVLDTREEAREFTVKVQSEAFRPARLKFQDGQTSVLSGWSRNWNEKHKSRGVRST